VDFEVIYRLHYACVWRTLRRLGIFERDAADLTQEVFVIACRRRHEFEGRSSERTWLLGIAFRVASNYRRRAGVRREMLTHAGFEEVPHALDFERQLEQREDLELLESVLQSLPLEQRAVFTMFEMEGLTGEDIAAALDVPLGTVRSRLRLAREAFLAAVDSTRQGRAVASGGHA